MKPLTEQQLTNLEALIAETLTNGKTTDPVEKNVARCMQSMVTELRALRKLAEASAMVCRHPDFDTVSKSLGAKLDDLSDTLGSWSMLSE